MLNRIRIVLCTTTHPGNIGAAARAIKTMGLSRLVLVTPRLFPDHQATAMASGADDVLASAVVCASLAEALEGTVLAVGVTARRRDLSHRMVSVRDMALEAVHELSQGDVALVFGTEMAGLSNAELDACQLLANIPADKGEVAREFPPATHEELEHFYQHLERVLRVIKYLDPENPRRLMIRLRRLFSRSRLERDEVSILRGILKALHPADEGSSRPL